MACIPYLYDLIEPGRYLFISTGKMRIEKVVDFIPLGIGDFMNIRFGDLLPDDSIDDKVISNNGDIIKVLATIVDILRHFTTQHPQTEIYFHGTTEDRNRLYRRIIRTYYPEFSKEFAIAGVFSIENVIHILPYNPRTDQEYVAFLIKRIF